jgi:hypothetical protein
MPRPPTTHPPTSGHSLVTPTYSTHSLPIHNLICLFARRFSFCPNDDASCPLCCLCLCLCLCPCLLYLSISLAQRSALGCASPFPVLRHTNPAFCSRDRERWIDSQTVRPATRDPRPEGRACVQGNPNATSRLAFFLLAAFVFPLPCHDLQHSFIQTSSRSQQASKHSCTVLYRSRLLALSIRPTSDFGFLGFAN